MNRAQYNGYILAAFALQSGRPLDDAERVACEYFMTADNIAAMLNDEFVDDKCDTETALVSIYNAWMVANGLQLGSADEHEHDPELTDAQRQWLQCYIIVWDGVTS